MSASVVAAIMYNYLLAPRDEPISVLFCCAQHRKIEFVSPFWRMLKYGQRSASEWKLLLHTANLCQMKYFFKIRSFIFSLTLKLPEYDWIFCAVHFFPPFHLLSSPLQYKLQFVGILLFIILGVSYYWKRWDLCSRGLKVAQELKMSPHWLRVWGTWVKRTWTLHWLWTCWSAARSVPSCVCYILAQMLGAGAASAIMRRSKESSFFIISKNFSCNINHYNHSDYKVTFSQITNHCCWFVFCR